jgi:secreted trypsin-like serine protease
MTLFWIVILFVVLQPTYQRMYSCNPHSMCGCSSKSNFRWLPKQKRRVSQIIIYSNYSNDTFVNDIALLKLASPLNMSDPAVRPICLPSVNSTTLADSEWPAANTTVNSLHCHSSIFIFLLC